MHEATPSLDHILARPNCTTVRCPELVDEIHNVTVRAL